MSGFKDKLQIFFLGLLLGLLLGGGFFLFKLDQYVKELSIYKSITHSNDSFTSHPDPKEQEQADKSTSHTKPVYTMNTPASRSGRKDSSLTASNAQKSRLGADSVKLSDSISHANAEPQQVSEDIILRKDELLSTRLLEELNISMVAVNPANSHDSLAAKMAGVRDEHAASRQYSTVEFWISPLNYKGYKMNRSKLVLYGLGDVSGVRLYKLDDEMYLHTGSVIYRLDYTNDFKPYERVTSEAILSKLK
jgi:hypothetical protein